MATFTFHNPSGSSYFTMETTRSLNYPNDTGTYLAGTPKYASGSFSTFTGSSSDHIVQSDFIFSEVIPPGTSSFVFNNAITIPAGTVFFRGTGEYDLIITT
jgi:hypothetical protein|tara:strand:- start:207 stop:509 length:303 start_codon:yes stop_codon:yes gene_type:complete